MASLLLVDDQVRMYMKIVDAAKPTTTVIVFNRLTSSLDDIIKQIEALPNRAFISVGLVQDGTNLMVDYRIVEDQAPCALDNLETEGLASWSPVITFLLSLKSLTGMATFDFISCLLGANPGFSYAISQISAQLGIVLQASTDMAGNLAQGGNWVQESDAVNIQDVYFTEDIAGYTELLYVFFYKPSTGMITELNTGLVSDSGNRVLGMNTFDSATIYAWGTYTNGGSGAPTGSGYTAIASNGTAFAALKSDTTIYAWGNSTNGGISGISGARIGGFVTGSGYTAIASNYYAFAALNSDKTIYAWGSSGQGGIGALVTGSGYTAIASNQQAFAALNSDTTIYAWGASGYGGISGISGTTKGGLVTGSGYTAIASTEKAFAALKSDTTIYAWGNSTVGGISGLIPGSGYTAIASNGQAFAALNSDTTIYAWGNSLYGGISGLITGSGYTAIASNDAAFAALKSNGTIYTWGSSGYGGFSGLITGSGYTAIASNQQAFAALNSDTTIYAWGNAGQGGIGVVTGSGYTEIASNLYAFAAFKSDTTIYAWGVSAYGGIGVVTGSGYTAIASNSQAFAALKSDGTIYAWGSSSYGGIGVVTGSGYTSIASNNFAFAAMTSVAIASSGLACFVKGTRLLSQNGYKPIEQFNHTDLLITSDGRTVDFKLCKTTIAKTDEDTAPYVIQAHAFGHNSPIAPLYLSPTHKVMIKKGVWVSPKDVAETNPLVKRCAIGESVTYYHVKCENYLRDNVIAEGIVSESYGTADAVKGVKDIFKWNSRLGGYTRKGPQALLKNKIL